MGTLLRALVALVLLSAALSLAPAPARAGATEEPATIEGTVTDDEGTPLAGVRVRMHNVTDEDTCAPEGETGCWVEQAVTTDAHGRYQAEVQMGDLVTVFITEPGYESQFRRDVSAGGEEDFALVAGTPGFDPVIVSGLVRDTAGHPVAGVAVVARETRNRASLATVQTDSTGRYLFAFDPLELDYYTLPVLVGVLVEGQEDPYAEQAVGTVTISSYYEPGAAYEVDFEDVPAPSGPSAPGDAAARPGRPRVTAARALGPRRALVRLVARSDGGSEISRFEAQCRGNGVVRRATGPTPRITVGHLEPSRRYRCRVRARNAVGWSAFSAYSPWFRTLGRRR